MVETMESSHFNSQDVSLEIEGGAVFLMLENPVDAQDLACQLDFDGKYKLHVFIDIEDKESLEDWRMVRKVYVCSKEQLDDDLQRISDATSRFSKYQVHTSKHYGCFAEETAVLRGSALPSRDWGAACAIPRHY